MPYGSKWCRLSALLQNDPWYMYSHYNPKIEHQLECDLLTSALKEAVNLNQNKWCGWINTDQFVWTRIDYNCQTSCLYYILTLQLTGCKLWHWPIESVKVMPGWTSWKYVTCFALNLWKLNFENQLVENHVYHTTFGNVSTHMVRKCTIGQNIIANAKYTLTIYICRNWDILFDLCMLQNAFISHNLDVINWKLWQGISQNFPNRIFSFLA